MLKISQLFLYPIKSLAGISVNAAEVTEKGFKNDRRLMLVDTDNRFLTIRQNPKMTRFQPELKEEGLIIRSLDTDMPPLGIPFPTPKSILEKVVIWNAEVAAHSLSEDINTWFSQA